MRNWALLILLTHSVSYSQKFFDLANAYYRVSPFNKIDSGSHQLHLQSYVFDVKIPLKLSDTNLWIFGLEHQYNSISTATNDTSFKPLKFHSTNLQVGFEHHWNPSFKTMFMGMFRLNSDYNSPDIRHFQAAALMMFNKQRSSVFSWTYGVYFNSEFFGPMLIPFFGLNYHPGEKFLLKFAAPINLEMAFRPVRWFRTGLRADGVNASYRARMNGSTDKYAYIDKADNNIWLFTEFNLFDNFWLQGRGGISVIRKYRQYEQDEKVAIKLGPVNLGDDRIETQRMFRNGWSFEARFIYRIPTE